MEIKAKLSYLRIAPRKVRLIADLIRKKPVAEAERILNFTIKRGVKDILKLLKSAIASARQNLHLEESNLYISKITIDEGPKLKRWMPRARGSASAIQKKTSHITIILDEIARQKTEHLGGPATMPKSFGREKAPKAEKPIFKPELEKPKPPPQRGEARPIILGGKIEKGLRRIFRRKSF